jgi:hypothetical protein
MGHLGQNAIAAIEERFGVFATGGAGEAQRSMQGLGPERYLHGRGILGAVLAAPVHHTIDLRLIIQFASSCRFCYTSVTARAYRFPSLLPPRQASSISEPAGIPLCFGHEEPTFPSGSYLEGTRLSPLGAGGSGQPDCVLWPFCVCVGEALPHFA